jgi:hypothetical protein
LGVFYVIHITQHNFRELRQIRNIDIHVTSKVQRQNFLRLLRIKKAHVFGGLVFF